MLPSQAWSDQSTSNSTIRLCKISEQPCSSQQPLLVSHCITVAADLTWEAFAHGHKLDPCQCQPLHGIIPHIDSASLQHLIHVLDTSTICAGHPDEKYVSMLEAKKGKRVIASDGCTSAYLDEQGQVTLNGHVYSFTVRSAGCEIVCHGSKCHMQLHVISFCASNNAYPLDHTLTISTHIHFEHNKLPVSINSRKS